MVVRLWNVITGEQINTLVGHTGWLTSVAISPDGNKIATGDFNKTAKIWDVETSRVLFTIAGATDDLTFSPDGGILAGSDDDGDNGDVGNDNAQFPGYRIVSPEPPRDTAQDTAHNHDYPSDSQPLQLRPFDTNSTAKANNYRGD